MKGEADVSHVLSQGDEEEKNPRRKKRKVGKAELRRLERTGTRGEKEGAT